MIRPTLAVSVVATISLAELACAHQAEPERADPPTAAAAPASFVDAGDAGETEATEVTEQRADPIATPAPPPPKPAIEFTTRIEARDDGTCVQIVEVDCPQGMMCNPPPPKPVPCPEPGV